MRRPRIGFLVDSIEESYQSTVLSGVLEGAQQADASVLCFCGGVLESMEARGEQENAIYDLVGPETIDGLVVMSGALGNVVGPNEMAAFCNAHRPLPIVSIAAALDGIPSVVVDDETGMRNVVAHLVESHGRREIAFIRGPKANQEAERRYRVVREVIADHDLLLHPDLVLPGSFDRASGDEAVRVLVEERHTPFDAIVAASDEMAIGAVTALLSRGIRVPDEVAVVGFDDLEAARFSVPPLTTVRQPLQEQGRLAVELVLSQLAGRSVPTRSLLHTEVVMRRSCGCGPAPTTAVTAMRASAVDLAVSAAERGKATLAQMAAALGVSSGDARWCARVLDSFVEELLHPFPGSSQRQFLRVFEEVLRVRLATGEAVGMWQDALGAMRREVVQWLAGDHERTRSAEELLHEARAVTGRYAELAQADRRTKAERFARVLNETSSALATSFDPSALIANLSEHLPRLGIHRTYASIYRGPGNPSKRSRLLFAVDPDRVIEPSAASFPSKCLVPDGILPERRSDFVVQPIFFHHEPLGVLFLELGPRMGSIYTTLRDQIGAALKGSELVRTVTEHDHQRQHLLRYIIDVTPDMQRVQPVAELHQKILKHALAMLEPAPGSAFMAPGQSSIPPPPREGVLATIDGATMTVRAGTRNRPLHTPLEDWLGAEQLEHVHGALERNAIEVGEHGAVIPLRVGDLTLAVVHVEGCRGPVPDTALLSTFANQASAAMRSMQLYEMAVLDPVTGAHTRSFFEDWLAREVRASLRSRVPLSVLMVDMDGMKRINDSVGHLVGDQALATTGKALRDNLRPNDLVGRFGGDEFVVLLPRTAVRAAERVAQRMIATLEGKSVRGLPLRISIGASTLQVPAPNGAPASLPADHYKRTVASLLAHADEALYRAKREGGMRVYSGEPSTWQLGAES